jgi:recombinational DNA repair protein (RecF pathway)
VATFETEAVVLRGIRYSEADLVLALFTRSHGRVSAIAKGARRTTSRLGGRLQPGVTASVTIPAGRGDLGTIRGASGLAAHAGLWVAGHRLQAAACVLETVMRVMPEAEPSEEGWNLLGRTLGLLARAGAAGPGRGRQVGTPALAGDTSEQADELRLALGRAVLLDARPAGARDRHAGVVVAQVVVDDVLEVGRVVGDELAAGLKPAADLLAHAEAAGPGPARLHPLVLGCQAKLLVVSGLLPVLGHCVRCGSGGPLTAFSATAGGVLCDACGTGAERVEAAAVAALAGLVGRPLAEAVAVVPAPAAAGVERMIGLVLREHLGVSLRSAAPL